MTVLLIGPDQMDKLKELKEFAEKKENWSNPQAILMGNEDPPGDDTRYVVTIPAPGNKAWRVVYSVDDTDDVGIIRHISMSIVGVEGRMPNENAVQLIADILEVGESFYVGPTRGSPEAVHYLSKYEET